LNEINQTNCHKNKTVQPKTGHLTTLIPGVNNSVQLSFMTIKVPHMPIEFHLVLGLYWISGSSWPDIQSFFAIQFWLEMAASVRYFAG
jgi:hypothetical protein